MSYVASGVKLGMIRRVNGFTVWSYLQPGILRVKYRVRNKDGSWYSTKLTLSEAVAAIPPRRTTHQMKTVQEG